MSNTDKDSIDNYPKPQGKCATCKHSEYITYYDGWHFDCHKHNSQVMWCDTCKDHEERDGTTTETG